MWVGLYARHPRVTVRHRPHRPPFNRFTGCTLQLLITASQFGHRLTVRLLHRITVCHCLTARHRLPINRFSLSRNFALPLHLTRPCRAKLIYKLDEAGHLNRLQACGQPGSQISLAQLQRLVGQMRLGPSFSAFRFLLSTLCFSKVHFHFPFSSGSVISVFCFPFSAFHLAPIFYFPKLRFVTASPSPTASAQSRPRTESFEAHYASATARRAKRAAPPQSIAATHQSNRVTVKL